MADTRRAGAGDPMAGPGRVANRRSESAAVLRCGAVVHREDRAGGGEPDGGQLAGETGARRRFSVAVLGATAVPGVLHGVDDGAHVEETIQRLHLDRTVMR